MHRLLRVLILGFLIVAFGALGPGLQLANAATPAPGPSGVPNGTFTITYTCTAVCSGSYVHTYTVTGTYNPTTCAGTFSGTGSYNGDPSVTENISGTTSGNSISFRSIYTGTGAGYTITSTSGMINANGSFSGNANGGSGQTFSYASSAGAINPVQQCPASETDLTSSNAGQPALPGGHIGTPKSNTLGSFNDPDGSASSFSVTVNWGGGNAPTSITCQAVASTTTTCGTTGNSVTLTCTATGCTVSGSHDYGQAGRFTATVTATETSDTQDFDTGATTSFSDLIFFDLYVTGNCSGTPAAANCGTTTGPTGTTFGNFTATEGGTVSGPVAYFTDGDFPPASNFTATINWGDGTTADTPTSINCTFGCYVYGSHTYKEEGTYTVTTSVHDTADNITSTNACVGGVASADGRASCTPLTATVSDAALTSTTNPSQTCTPTTSCQVFLGSFHDTNPYCDTIPPEEAISPVDGSPHYRVTITFSNGTTASPTAVTETAPGSCTFDVYYTTTYSNAQAPITAYFTACDENGGAYDVCTSTSSSPTTISVPQPGQTSNPCSGTACPIIQAAFSQSTGGRTVSGLFQVRVTGCPTSNNGCTLTYRNAALEWRDTAPGGLNLPYCNQRPNPGPDTCLLTITSVQCTSSDSATVYGTYTYTDGPQTFRIDLSGTSTTTGTITIQTTTQDGTPYYYTVTLPNIVEVSCP